MPAATLRRSAPATSGSATTTQAKKTAPMVPFTVASRNQDRYSFTIPSASLGTSVLPQTPVQIPAMGYLKYIDLEVTITGSGGTTPAFTSDGPWNALSQIQFRNASGNDLIVPSSGYQVYLYNKYGLAGVTAPYSDQKNSQQYAATAPSAHFFLRVPCEVSPADAFCSIPALASNRNYQMVLTYNALSQIMSGSPTATITVNGTAWFWSEPASSTKSGAQQQSSPPYTGSISMWQIEQPIVNAGDHYIKSNNVGNVISHLVFVLRDTDGDRTDDDWPALSELYVDNEPMFYLTQNEWCDWMSKLYGLTATSKDAKSGLDTGVYVVPFAALAEGIDIPNARRSQYLPTLDSTFLQIRGTSWGSDAGTLEILTNSVVPKVPGSTATSTTALYGIR